MQAIDKHQDSAGNRWPLVRSGGWILLATLLVLVPPIAPPVYVVQATDTLVFVLLAVSVNLLIGYGGMISLGHAAYFAIGGYTAGLLATNTASSMFVALLAVPFAAALAALVIGAFCIRVANAYFIMLTLAFGQLVYTVVWKWRALTGGDDGLLNITPPVLFLDPVNYYYLTLAIGLACVLAISRICRSPFGAVLKAIRDTPNRARSIGINVRQFHLAAFTIAGFFAGVAGALYAFHNRSMFPQSALWITSTEIMLMAVVGGVGHFIGPIVGAVFIKTLDFLIPRVTEFWLFFLGLIVLLVAFVMPQGLVQGYHQWRAKRSRVMVR
jgi:branched-chain amino acid transport system permease protein